MDINSTINSTLYFHCLNQAHVGVVVSYVVILLCFFLGTPAHSWILWLFFRDGWKIKPTQVFLVNFTVLELMFCIQCGLEMVGLIFSSDTSDFWRVKNLVYGLSWIGTPLMQICICVERYLAVIHPIIFLTYKGIQYRIASAAIVWLVTATYATYEAITGIYCKFVFDIVFFTAVTAMSFCCVSVLCALKHPGPGDTQITTERGRDVGNQQKRNAFKTILSGLLIILITYLPQISITLFHWIDVDEGLLLCNIFPIMDCFNIVSVMITPLEKKSLQGRSPEMPKPSKGN